MTAPALSTQAQANRTGIAAMVTAQLFFIVNDTLMKLATGAMPSGQTIALRGILASSLILVWVFVTGEARHLPRVLSPLVLTRGILEALVAILYITALAYLPIADVTAIFLVTPLLITALSVVVLGETVGWRRWTAVGVGFCGMLLVVRPGGTAFDWPALLVLASALGAAVRDLVTRRIDPTIPTAVITLNTTVTVTLVSAGFMAVQGVAPVTTPVLGYLIAAAMVVIVGNFMIIRAFRGVEVSAISPFRYIIVVWAILSGVLVFGERPDGIALIGIALIVASGLYTMHRERVRSRQS